MNMCRNLKGTFSFLILIKLLSLSKGYVVKDGPLLKERPSWLKVCQRDDPKLNDCLTDLFKEMFPVLARGIPEINVDPFEPLHLDQVSVTKGSGAVILTGSFLNLTVHGPSNSTPTYTDMDLINNAMNFGVYIPLLDIRTKYNLKGKILILPLVGYGNCEMLLTGVDTRITTAISFPTVDGREILKVDSMNVQFDLAKLKIKLHNLFNGNKVLGLTVNNFINQNALEIVRELDNNINESLADIFTDIINNIFSKIPTDLWLPKLNKSQKTTAEIKSEAKTDTPEVIKA